MLATREKTRIEQACHVAGFNVAIGNALVIDKDFDERFEPRCAPGAVAHKLDAVAAFFGPACDLDRDVVRADRD